MGNLKSTSVKTRDRDQMIWQRRVDSRLSLTTMSNASDTESECDSDPGTSDTLGVSQLLPALVANVTAEAVRHAIHVLSAINLSAIEKVSFPLILSPRTAVINSSPEPCAIRIQYQGRRDHHSVLPDRVCELHHGYSRRRMCLRRYACVILP